MSNGYNLLLSLGYKFHVLSEMVEGHFTYKTHATKNTTLIASTGRTATPSDKIIV